MDVEEYLDDLNELAFEFMVKGDEELLERVNLTAYSAAAQFDVDIQFASAEDIEKYRDTVPP